MAERESLRNPPGSPSLRPSEEDEGVVLLLSRLRQGDTEAVGEFVRSYGAVIRAHYRRRIGRSMQRLVDSQDLLSTIARRLCQRVSGQRLHAADRRQLWALVFRIGDDALIDRMKILSRLRQLEQDGSPIVETLRTKLDHPDDLTGSTFAEELKKILDALPSDIDRSLLVMWLQGVPLAEAGSEFGFTPAATRKRWERIRTALRQQFANEGH